MLNCERSEPRQRIGNGPSEASLIDHRLRADRGNHIVVTYPAIERTPP